MASHEEVIETHDVSELGQHMTVPGDEPAQAEHCTDLRPYTHTHTRLMAIDPGLPG